MGQIDQLTPEHERGQTQGAPRLVRVLAVATAACGCCDSRRAFSGALVATETPAAYQPPCARHNRARSALEGRGRASRRTHLAAFIARFMAEISNTRACRAPCPSQLDCAREESELIKGRSPGRTSRPRAPQAGQCFLQASARQHSVKAASHEADAPLPAEPPFLPSCAWTEILRWSRMRWRLSCAPVGAASVGRLGGISRNVGSYAR